jgi:hypothetical protein
MIAVVCPLSSTEESAQKTRMILLVGVRADLGAGLDHRACPVDASRVCMCVARSGLTPLDRLSLAAA